MHNKAAKEAERQSTQLIQQACWIDRGFGKLEPWRTRCGTLQALSKSDAISTEKRGWNGAYGGAPLAARYSDMKGRPAVCAGLSWTQTQQTALTQAGRSQSSAGSSPLISAPATLQRKRGSDAPRALSARFFQIVSSGG
jgi:hypothetical protein